MLSWRLSAAALMLAPLLDIVGQLMHPASISAVDNPALHIQEVAESHVWMTSHLLFLLAFVVNLFGLWTLERLLDAEAAKPIGRLLTTVSLVGSAVAIVFITVDGFAVKLLADAWLQANATDQPAALRAAIAFDLLEDALFGVWLLLYFGLTSFVLGITHCFTGFPRWLSVIHLIGGSIGMTTGLSVLTIGISVPAFILLGIAALGFWIPLFASGVLIWRG
jgi:hypothetical protein